MEKIKYQLLTVFTFSISILQAQVEAVYFFDQAIEKKYVPTQKRFADSTAFKAYIREYLQDVRTQGLLEASVDQLDNRDSVAYVNMHLGPVYDLLSLDVSGVPEPFLSKAGYRKRQFANRPFDVTQMGLLQEKLLQSAENDGFPYAEVYLENIVFKDNGLSGALMMNLNQLVLWKDLKVVGSAELSGNFLGRYLGILPGQAFSLKKFKKIEQRIRELPFVQLKEPPELTFRGADANLKFNLEKKSASRFDFIIGFLPNNQQVSRFLLTGTFNSELQNALGQGERIFARFEQLRPESQLLELEFDYPYILNLPFGADFSLNLYKRDTSYLDLEVSAGIQYLLEGNNYVKLFWSNRSSSLLGINENLLLNSEQLPDRLDVSYPAFGLELAYEALDYRFNPRKGWNILLNGSAGTKRIQRNSRIEELDFGFLYDSLKLRSTQYRIQAETAIFLPLFQTSTLKFGLRSAFIFSNQAIYQNEQYRLGGNNLMRGFDEDFFFATNYAISTLEYRFLIGTNSFLYLFGDYGWLEDKTVARNSTVHPLGFGAGISFETKVGVFGVSLAYGRLDEQALDLSSPKVHFGYVSRF